ncbi:uncharacterized protein Z518_06943 [Rhinocladiella mackenziei CBS 650.93]|uniref:Transcription factor IIIC 90kDa subunit N-terminal domain-containing protein n=1 Tax=Rhinocladiella mackenziei CBS 650.93 TaxID=1442369 RepID=A0A0D2IJG4_9EURO|nr:uncharacterized protein Z518_06943 [Rhinocladiella mackenziei CBS 650.93]KIX03391.1 hypothetical protein Z518_06943 [Rhinocladiella mackenziei CBS 650.93]
MAASQLLLDPVTLPYWPTCKNAVSWSGEGLAVAAGEVVHILTPRDTSHSLEAPGHKRWHTFTLRVNQFDPSEWPFLPMAPLGHFSIGEELSESPVVSLAWSPSGLGLYRRSVLAILTSNLVLSFWETNGRLGVWQRTGIVNQHLPVETGSEKADESRRKRRIRAFHWLPGMEPLANSKWGPQFLAVADDNNTILVFHVWKIKTASYGQWSFERIGQHRAAKSDPMTSPMHRRISLRAILSQTSPISMLETTEWHLHEDPDENTRVENVIVKVSFGPCGQAKYLSIHVKRPVRNDTDDDSPAREWELSIEESQMPADLPLAEPPAERLFEPAIQKPWSDFNEKFALGGRVRIRHWGSACSPDQTQAAACVSLHPSDMIESGIPSNQHSIIVFIQLQEPLATETAIKDDYTVYEEILALVVNSPTEWIRTELDKNIVRNATALIFRNGQLPYQSHFLIWETNPVKGSIETPRSGGTTTPQTLSKMRAPTLNPDIKTSLPRPHTKRLARYVVHPYNSHHLQRQPGAQEVTNSADAVSPSLLFKSLVCRNIVPNAAGSPSILASWNCQMARA